MADKKLYIIVHYYDVDGGFGDAIPREEVIATVWATEEETKSFLEKYDKPYVYDTPYADLECHGVNICELDPIDISELDEDTLEEKFHGPDFNWRLNDDEEEN